MEATANALDDRDFGRLGGLEASVAEMKAGLNDFKEKADARLGNVETRLGGLETRMGVVEMRLGRVEADIGEVKGDIKDVRADIKDVRADINGLHGETSSLREETKAIAKYIKLAFAVFVPMGAAILATVVSLALKGAM